MKGVKRGFLKVGAQICFLPSKIPQQFVPPGKNFRSCENTLVFAS